MKSKTRLILDFAPLGAFFIAFRLFGLSAATAALIGMTLLSLVIIYALEKRLALMPLISGIIVAVFGGLSIYLHDERFIKIKPTIVNLLFAAILIIGVCMRKPMLKYLLSDAMSLSEKGWQLLSLRWGLFFIFLAALNEFIWRNYPTDLWVNFKVFGMFTLTMVFTVSQIPLIKKYWIEKEPS